MHILSSSHQNPALLRPRRPPSAHVWNHVPTVQATSSPVNKQPFKRMDLSGAHKKVSTLDTSRPRCWTMWVEHLPLTFLLVSFFLWNTPPISCLPSSGVMFFAWLNNHKNRIKTYACIHHIVLAKVQNIICPSRSHNISRSHCANIPRCASRPVCPTDPTLP